MDKEANYKRNSAITDRYTDLQSITNELTNAGYRNNEGLLTESPLFTRLVELAGGKADDQTATEDYDLDGARIPDEPFHIEADIYDSGDYANLLIIPSNGTYIVVGNDEHLSTLSKSCNEPACWEQHEGSLEEEVIEKLGAAIDSYTQSF